MSYDRSDDGDAPRPVCSEQWWSGWDVVLLAFIASRLVIAACVLVARSTMVRGPFWQPGGFLEAMTQWDSFYYIYVARHGPSQLPELSATADLSPFFPLLVRAASLVFQDLRVAALVTANACLLVAGFLLHRLARIEFASRTAANAAVMFLMFGPVSFFFSAAYPDATFLMLAIGAYLAAVERRWLVAGICGLCIAATHNVGLWIAAPLLCEHLRQTWDRHRPFASFRHPNMLAIALVPLGFLVVMLYSYWQSGDPLLSAQAAMASPSRDLMSPLARQASAQSTPLFYYCLFFGALGVATLLLATAAFMKLRVGYVVWGGLLILTCVATGAVEAIPRHLSVVFPFYLVLAAVATSREWSRHPMLACSAAVLTINTLLLASGYWMT